MIKKIVKKIANRLSAILFQSFHDDFDGLFKQLNNLQRLALDLQNNTREIKKQQIMERVEKYLLNVCANPVMQRGITKEFLRSIEIGIHSYCNRKCWFCANGKKIDRHSQKVDMPDDMFLKILNELAEIEYRGSISFHRFNEPLADKTLILKRLSQVKTILPHSYPRIFTNGDYLTCSGYLDELIENPQGGTNSIFISLYLSKNESFYDGNTISTIYKKFFDRVNVTYKQPFLNKKENRFECHLTGKYSGKVTVVVPNFVETAFVMAGAVETGRQTIRYKPCSQPFTGLWIDYHGYVMPCCMMRYDVAEHKYATLGTVRDKSVFELFCGEKIVDFRNQLKNYGPKKAACTYCDLHGEWMEKSVPLY